MHYSQINFNGKQIVNWPCPPMNQNPLAIAAFGIDLIDPDDTIIVPCKVEKFEPHTDTWEYKVRLVPMIEGYYPVKLYTDDLRCSIGENPSILRLK